MAETKDEIPNNDFGFTFESGDEEVRKQLEQDKAAAELSIGELNALIQGLRELNREMYRKIMKLLLNLKKNPETATIRWPNRVDAIDKFIKELDDLRVKKDPNGEEDSKK